MPAKRKFDPPRLEQTGVHCRSCGIHRSLDEYRWFDDSKRMDFCVACEHEWGTVNLYRRFTAYGTDDIVKAVFLADRTPEKIRTGDQARLLISKKAESAPKSKEELAQRELERRELMRRRLIYYIKEMQPGYMPGWVHQDICRKLEKFMRDIEEEKSPRLMIFVPPRHGKSEIASKNFPSWVLGHHPDWPIISTSYAQSLPLGFSRWVRDRLDSREYKAVFPGTSIRSDARGIEEWQTEAGGGFIAAGVGTGITGKGFKLGIVDDPIKDQEEASSETIRNNTFEWYQAVFRSRAAPGAGILFINTRWHHDDPAGRLLDIEEELRKAGVPNHELENWTVISYPAIAEGDEYLMRDGSIVENPINPEEALRLLRRKGDALHPERYPVNELRKIKNSYTSSMWASLYQQRPTPQEGDYFHKRDFVFRGYNPDYLPLMTVFMTADYAITKKQRSDYTTLGVFALDWNDNLWLIEMRRGRWGTYEIAQNITQMVEVYKPQVYAGEQGAIHAAVWPVVENALAEKRLYIATSDRMVPVTDKEVRARPLQARMQRRKFIFGNPNEIKPDVYEIIEREMLQFPNGKHDDTVDCCAWAARLALDLSTPKEPFKNQTVESWKTRLSREIVNGHAAGTSFMAR